MGALWDVVLERPWDRGEACVLPIIQCPECLLCLALGSAQLSPDRQSVCQTTPPTHTNSVTDTEAEPDTCSLGTSRRTELSPCPST